MLRYLHIREDDHRQDHDEGHSPHCCAHHLGHPRVSPLGAADWMDHSQVSIHGHDCEAEDGCELVHGVCGHDDAAEKRAEGPVGEDVLCGEEGQPDDVQLISHSQVQDIDVGDCFHLGVAQHHVDGQSVTSQTHQEDREGDDRSHQCAAAMKRDALGGHVGGEVPKMWKGKQGGRTGDSRGVELCWKNKPVLVQMFHSFKLN